MDYLSHTSKINEGEAEQYYIADHHDPIVSREIWDRAQELLDKQSWQKWKRREQQRLMPVRSGLLKGFVSISSEWKAVSITRLVSASNKVLKDEATTDDKQSNAEEYNDEESEENEMAENSVLEGFEVVELEQSKGDSVLTLTSTNLKFNKATAVELGYPAFVRMLVNAATKQVAIQPCSEKTKNAVPFSKDESKQTYAVVVKVPALLTAVRKLADSNEGDGAISFNGVLYPNERAVIFDLAKGSVPKKRHRRTKAEIEAERLNTSSTDKEEK